MVIAEYLVLFLAVATMGAGLPGLGDSALIAAGTLAGEGRIDLLLALVVAMTSWMLGSLVGYAIGERNGRWLLVHPGWFEGPRHRLLKRGERAFSRYEFTASAVLPGFVSGIFRVRRAIFVLGALVAGSCWIGMYVLVSYFVGPEVARSIGDAGTTAIVGVAAVVVAGLGARALVAWWRGRDAVDP